MTIFAWETEAERQLAVIDDEIAGMRHDLRRLVERPPATSDMQSRRAERAALIQRQLEWLIPKREEMAADVERERRAADPKPPEGGRWSPFSATLTSTVETLANELRHLGAERVVLELDLRERDIRVDGLPRADAKPAHDGVALAFHSKHGPLRYETAEFTSRWSQPGWQANLRAIALGMEALRAVDRYGVSKRGEQYRGWRALAAGPLDPVALIQTPELAWEVITREAGIPVDSSPLMNGISQAEAIKRALHKAHPDKGGTAERFQLVQRAREVLAA